MLRIMDTLHLLIADLELTRQKENSTDEYEKFSSKATLSLKCETQAKQNYAKRAQKQEKKVIT